ncbi:hypothetical protein GGR53DRAFT_64600 [Hypoxylon sp. FL1150]|nr:hypothetical protein GGR53DRAFT_64600 [Hypoxylon sp. FL1150]
MDHGIEQENFTLDITLSGDTTSWFSAIDSRDLSTRLRETKLTAGTRVIVFSQYHRLYMQNHVGVEYDIDPAFFLSVKMNMPQLWRSIINHHVLEFLAGSRMRHLNLGYGWVCLMIRRNDNCNVVIVSGAHSRSDATYPRGSDGNSTLIDLGDFNFP